MRVHHEKKKSVAAAAVFLLLAWVVLPVSAMGKDTKKPATMIGYAAPALYGGQLYIQTSLVDNAQAKGWGVVTTNANADPQKQNNDIDYLISLGVKAIVTVPEDSAGICAAVEKARMAKIPFFTIDRSPAGCKIDMTVLSDNRLAGQQAAQVMVDELIKKYGSPKGKVLEITGNLSQNVGQLRRDGFHDIVDKYKDIAVIQKVGDWDAAKGQQVAIDVLSANTDLDGIYMHSDNVYGPGTKAAMDQLNRYHKRGEPGHIILTGVDGGPWILEAILDGIADGAGSQPVSDFGIVVKWIEQNLARQAGKGRRSDSVWSGVVPGSRKRKQGRDDGALPRHNQGHGRQYYQSRDLDQYGQELQDAGPVARFSRRNITYHSPGGDAHALGA